jgi:antitoxin (DNA-binding transcriptional repressor) of toxin-antitoxin stability system
MKTRTVNIARLKAELSRFLHELRADERLVVMDRKRPVAEIRPLPPVEDPWKRLERRFPGFRRGTQQWSAIKLTRSQSLGLVEALLAGRAGEL